MKLVIVEESQTLEGACPCTGDRAAEWDSRDSIIRQYSEAEASEAD